ncbi:MAG: permease [Gemmataceae bacterium]|nr:permease [Gemmataceae bacterium]
MLPTIFWSIVLRTGQVAVEASTTLLCGFLVAGVMRRMLGADGTRRLFGGSGWRGLLRAWGVGWLLPVCSLGVLPIAREMRRAGVPSSTILAFVLAAPHINPLSLLYGLTLSEPLVIICFAGANVVLALGAGMVWERFLAAQEDLTPFGDEPMPAPGLRRLAAVAVSAGRDVASPLMGYILLGLFFTGLLAGVLPHGCLGVTMRHDDWISPLLMTAVALPLYSGPLQGMMRLGLMFEHGNSVGAAFALFELGIGLNLGLIVWLMSLFGWRRVLRWMGWIAAGTLLLAYTAEKPLYFAHEEASHTHAFDDWTSPFAFSSAVDWLIVRDKLLQKVEVLEPVALAGLAFLVVLGLLAQKLDRHGRVEAFLTRLPPDRDQPVSVWNRNVPGPVLGFVALLGLVVFSVVALYIYYPAPKEAFAEIIQVRADALVAVNTGHKDEAIRQIQQWDLLTRKLQVGVFIRTGRFNPEVAQITEDLRERLEELRDALLAGQVTEAKQLVPRVEDAYRRCRAAYETRA